MVSGATNDCAGAGSPLGRLRSGRGPGQDASCPVRVGSTGRTEANDTKYVKSLLKLRTFFALLPRSKSIAPAGLLPDLCTGLKSSVFRELLLVLV